MGSMCTRQGHTGWLSSTAGPGCPRAPVGRLGRTSDHHRGLVNFRPVPSASSALRIIPPLGGPLMPGRSVGEAVFSPNVFKARDAWSIPNDQVHSWQPWVLPALPVGTRVPHGCELEGCFQAPSVCLGDRHAPPGGRASGTRWASSPPSDQWRRDTQRRGGHVRRKQRLEGCGHKPRNTWSPRNWKSWE